MLFIWSQGSSVSIVTRLRAERSGVRFPAEVRDLFPSLKPCRLSVGHTYRGSVTGVTQPGRETDPRLHLALLRLGAGVPLFPLYAFVEWKGTILNFTFPY